MKPGALHIEVSLPEEIERTLRAQAEKYEFKAEKHITDYLMRLFGVFLQRMVVEPSLQVRAAKLGWDTTRMVADLFQEFIWQSKARLVSDLLAWERLEDIIARYAAQELTQGEAAELAGLSRAEFIEALSRSQVSPFQYGSADELREEIFRE